MLTLAGNYSVVNIQLSELNIHSHMNAQTMTVYKLSNPPELNYLAYSHLNCDDKDRQYYRPQSCQSH